MKAVHYKKQKDNKNTIGSVVTSVAGVVAIAGVAVAATMALNNKKTRKKVKKALVSVTDQAIDYVDTLKTESKVKRGNRTIKKIAEDTKKVVEESN